MRDKDFFHGVEVLSVLVLVFVFAVVVYGKLAN
jgi:type II secretory pathway component PulK